MSTKKEKEDPVAGTSSSSGGGGGDGGREGGGEGSLKDQSGNGKRQRHDEEQHKKHRKKERREPQVPYSFYSSSKSKTILSKPRLMVQQDGAELFKHLSNKKGKGKSAPSPAINIKPLSIIAVDAKHLFVNLCPNMCVSPETEKQLLRREKKKVEKTLPAYYKTYGKTFRSSLKKWRKQNEKESSTKVEKKPQYSRKPSEKKEVVIKLEPQPKKVKVKVEPEEKQKFLKTFKIEKIDKKLKQEQAEQKKKGPKQLSPLEKILQQADNNVNIKKEPQTETLKSSQIKVESESNPVSRKVGIVRPFGNEQEENFVFRANTRYNYDEGSHIYHEMKRLLGLNTVLEYPVAPTTVDFYELGDYTVRKMAFWFLKEEEDPPDYMKVHPELHDHEINEEDGKFMSVSENEKREIEEDIGCVSDPEGIDQTENEHFRKAKKKKLDPDIVDEYCGFASLESRIYRPDNPAIKYKKFFQTKEGTGYDKGTLEVVCFLCKRASKPCKIHGQRQLGAHIRSEEHKDAFRKFSLEFADYQEEAIPASREKVFKAKLAHYPNQTSKKAKKALLPPGVDPDENRREEAAANNDEGDGVMSFPSLSMSLFDLQEDTDQKRAKICLKKHGFWTKDMERDWVKMQQAEARLIQEYCDLREKYVSNPDSHPLTSTEWAIFWDRRATELENQGRDPANVDLSLEWIPFWLKRMQEILKLDTERKLENMKKSFRLDGGTLKRICEKEGLSLASADIMLPEDKPVSDALTPISSKAKDNHSDEWWEEDIERPPKKEWKESQDRGGNRGRGRGRDNYHNQRRGDNHNPRKKSSYEIRKEREEREAYNNSKRPWVAQGKGRNVFGNNNNNNKYYKDNRGKDRGYQNDKYNNYNPASSSRCDPYPRPSVRIAPPQQQQQQRVLPVPAPVKPVAVPVPVPSKPVAVPAPGLWKPVGVPVPPKPVAMPVPSSPNPVAVPVPVPASPKPVAVPLPPKPVSSSVLPTPVSLMPMPRAQSPYKYNNFFPPQQRLPFYPPPQFQQQQQQPFFPPQRHPYFPYPPPQLQPYYPPPPRRETQTVSSTVSSALVELNRALTDFENIDKTASFLPPLPKLSVTVPPPPPENEEVEDIPLPPGTSSSPSYDDPRIKKNTSNYNPADPRMRF